jgi:hypothetical protein
MQCKADSDLELAAPIDPTPASHWGQGGSFRLQAAIMVVVWRIRRVEFVKNNISEINNDNREKTYRNMSWAPLRLLLPFVEIVNL